MTQKITPFLWFDGRIEEAVQFYTKIFPNSRVHGVSKQSATLELEGQRLMLFNGGAHYQLSPAVSLFVSCQTQAEIDRLWTQLTAGGGQDSYCGWLKDKFGLSWQLVPTQLESMLRHPDPARAKRVMAAMMHMNKLNIAKLQQAFDLES